MIEYGVANFDSVFPVRRESAIILGNGPSMRRFAAQFTSLYSATNPSVWGVNRVCLADYSAFRPVNYYIALDRACWKTYPGEISALGATCFCPARRWTAENLPDNYVVFDIAGEPFAFAREYSTEAKIAHGFTSVYACMQLAVISGAKRIDLFGVDGGRPDADGMTHAHGAVQRGEKIWLNIMRGIVAGVKHLQAIGIDCNIHSDIFPTEALNA